jgi:hypothetical protein
MGRSSLLCGNDDCNMDSGHTPECDATEADRPNVKVHLYTRCRECHELMFYYSEGTDVVYCGCSGLSDKGLG